MNNRRRHRAASVLCCLGLCLCVCARLLAQQGSGATSQSNAAAASQGGGFKIQVGVNSVLVPVVVRDGKGRVVGDLKEQDFQIFDQDKAKAIAGFTVERRAVAAGGAPGAAAAGGAGTTPFVSSMAPPAVVPQRFVVFLFDDMHFEPSDLLRIKKVATKMLGESLGETDMAAVVTTSGTNSGATRDRAVLESAVGKISVHSLYQHDSHACPNIGVYQADLIANKHNEQALEAAVAAYSSCAHVGGTGGSSSPGGGGQSSMGGVAVDSDMASRMVRSAAGQVLEMGDRDVAVTLSTVKEYVRRMGQLPGQHVMILFSPGFLTVTQTSMIEKSQVLDLAARSNVTISAMDTRGLYTTNMDASERGGDSARDLMTGESSQYHSETMNLDEDVMAELANGSGGKFFHNNNDLEGGFKELTQAPEYLYILEMSLDKVKADGTYHRLKVKVDRDALKVEARRGYFAPRAEKKQK
jgi:VWFA-related protein